MNTRKNFNFVLISAIVTAIVLVFTSAITNVNATANTTTITGVSVVKAGGGNATAPLTSFTPQQIEIKVGYWTINPMQTLLYHLLCQVPQNLWFYLLVLMVNPPWEDLL